MTTAHETSLTAVRDVALRSLTVEMASIVNQIRFGQLDNYDRRNLDSDHGHRIACGVIWRRNTDLVGWVGNDLDYDMRHLVTVKL